MRPSILVVDDEFLVRQLLRKVLDDEGYDVTAVGSLKEAGAALDETDFDLILLDILLPDGDGLAFCSRLRSRLDTPIVMMSVKGKLTDRVAGLDIGADDYIVKPFEVSEVVARVRAHLRRASNAGVAALREHLDFGRFQVDFAMRDALIRGNRVHLTQKEFELLELFARRADRAVSKDAILDQLWGSEEAVGEKILAVYIRRLRQKLEEDPDRPQFLKTLRGFGYVLMSKPQAEMPATV